jgi:catechol 2,3-dioxygenase-like lactoylglutathione lyase family enzyme
VLGTTPVGKAGSGKEGLMPLESFYPVLLVEDVTASARFYTEHMGFGKVFESDWYVSLKHREDPAYELAIISNDHETIPEGFRRPTSALLLNFEVPSVESEYERLRAAGVKILQPLEDLPAGQRHFICQAPGGVMVDVIQEIPPSPEFAEQYLS